LPPIRAAWAIVAVFLLAGCAKPGAPSTPGGGSDGASLAFGAPVAIGAGGPEPVVAIARDDGAIYVAAQDAGGGAPHAFVSTDGGRSWSAASAVTSAPPGC